MRLKFEARPFSTLKPGEIRNKFKTRMFKTGLLLRSLKHFEIKISDLFRISCFGFRIFVLAKCRFNFRPAPKRGLCFNPLNSYGNQTFFVPVPESPPALSPLLPAATLCRYHTNRNFPITPSRRQHAPRRQCMVRQRSAQTFYTTALLFIATASIHAARKNHPVVLRAILYEIEL